MKSKVLVAGATGYLGKYVVKELKEKGYYVIAIARKKEKLDSVKEFIDDIKLVDITNADSLKGICDDIDYVFSSVGITRQKDGLTYMDVDYQANANLLAEAKKSNVKKFIYVSVLNAHLMKDLKIIEAKEKFVDELVNSGIDYSIIRPNGFFSDMEELLTMAFKGTVYLFGDGTFKGNPIHGEDLAKVCVNAINNTKREINIGGPDVLTHNQMAEFAFAAVNKEPRIKHIPLWVKSLVLFLTRFFTGPKTYGPIEFFMTVLAMDMVTAKYGKHKLDDYYRKVASLRQVQ